MRTESKSLFRAFARAGAAGAAALWLAGCALSPGMHADAAKMPPVTRIDAQVIARQATVPNDALRDTASLRTVRATAYRIGPGDALAIGVLKHPELAAPADDPRRQAAFVVDGDGELAYPYVGKLRLAGLTVNEAREALAAALSRYIRAPQVTLRMAEFRSARVYVDGAVREPGAQEITDLPMTLALALSRAGGTIASGDASRVSLVRSGQAYRLDLPALASAGVDAADIALLDGDRVRVADRAEHPVFVAGEVGQPRPLPMRDGALSLGEALAQAGSLNQAAADARSVYVVRLEDPAQAPQVFQLDARSPAGLALAARFPLRANDLVYVQPAGLVRWNRVMTLLVSSSVSLYNTQRAVDDR